MRRLTAALTAALVAAPCLGAVPASAVTVRRGFDGDSVSSVTDDTLGCFRVVSREAVTAVATAHGAVRTAPVQVEVYLPASARPTEVIADTRAALAADDPLLCVGGLSVPAVSGTVVYTLVAHTQSGNLVTVLVCTFSNSGPRCR